MSFTFDETWDRQFKASPFRLRFELGGEQYDNILEPVPRFMQTLTRSRALRETSFADSQQLWALIESWEPDGFEALRRIGFRAIPIAEWQVVEEMANRSVECLNWQAFDVTGDDAACDTLLWSSIVKEMPIEPKAPVNCYLADMERGILLNIYDDRGMDITALAASSLTQVRQRFDSWILPYDRSRIDVAVEP